jgi:hypothetical protein
MEQDECDYELLYALSWHWNQDSHVCIETRIHFGLPGNFGLVLPRDDRFFFSSYYSDRLWAPSIISLSTSCTLLGDKLVEVATYPSTARIKSVYVALPPILHFYSWHMAWCLIKHRYNFASFYCSSVCMKGLRRTTHTLRIPDISVGKE